MTRRVIDFEWVKKDPWNLLLFSRVKSLVGLFSLLDLTRKLVFQPIIQVDS